MAKIRIKINTPDLSKQVDAEVPDDATMSRLLPALAKKMGLPLEDNQHFSILYRLHHGRTNYTLRNSDTIGGVGAEAYDTFTLIAGRDLSLSSAPKTNWWKSDFSKDENLNETPHRLRVFLCHSSSDKPAVRELYIRLSEEMIDPWLDEKKLIPGQDWNFEITKAVKNSDVILICLSPNSINKAGYVQKEIKTALDVADEQPEGSIFLIPTKLEECNVPERLKRWQWLNYFEEDGHSRLLHALRTRAWSLGLPFRQDG